MEPYSPWEALLIGALALLAVFWFRPGIKAALERSRQSEGRWADALPPLVLVVLFVIFLVYLSRNPI
jgi:hypothetical protein